MSVLVLDDKSYKNIIVTLQYLKWESLQESHSQQTLNKYDINFRMEKSFIRQIRLLRALNHRAYNKRYKEIGYDKKLNCPGKVVNKYQLLKSLECIKYNIDCENKYLDFLIYKIEIYIKDTTPEYKNAIWG